MSSLPARRSETPHGAAALFFIQMFSTLGFAVLYSSLVLYATKHLHFSDQQATAVMGVFGAFNYGLHLFGGYLGGRFLSNRNLFIGGMVLQVFGCACIAGGTEAMLYWGLALFLTGSGLNVTCINMMLTQRYAPEDIRRESAFLWNYAGMNVGFFIGFAAAGYFQETENYRDMFLFATVGNVLAIVFAVAWWKRIGDLHTPLIDATARAWRLRLAAGIAILVGLVPVVWFLLQYPVSTGTIVKAICALVAAALVWLTIRHPDPLERNNMWAYLILTLGSLVFWSLYQMAPSGLQLFAVRNVDLVVWGVKVSPQWIQNINTLVIVFGGPLLALLFERLARTRLEHRRAEAVRRLPDPDGPRLPPAAGGDTRGGFARAVLLRLAVLELRAAIRRRAADLAGRLRDDRPARAAPVPGDHDGQLDARHRPRVAVRERLLGADPRRLGSAGRLQRSLFHALRPARLGQRRGGRRAGPPDPVPAPADPRQGDPGRGTARAGRGAPLRSARPRVLMLLISGWPRC
jgi:amino acid/peptide:H+ symporter